MVLTNVNVLSRFPVGGNRHTVIASIQLSATDVSARTTMKGAAKCDKHCDLQNSVNQQGLERILRFRDTPESMPASVSTSVSCCRRVVPCPMRARATSLCRQLVSVHQGASCEPLMLSAHSASGGNQPAEPGLVLASSLVLATWPALSVPGDRCLDMKLGQQTR